MGGCGDDRGSVVKSPGSTLGISCALDSQNRLHTSRMPHRCSRLPLQHVTIISHIWSCSHRLSVGRDGRPPLTTRKTITLSRTSPYGRISVRVLQRDDCVSDDSARAETNSPRKRSLQASKCHSLLKDCHSRARGQTVLDSEAPVPRSGQLLACDTSWDSVPRTQDW